MSEIVRKQKETPKTELDWYEFVPVVKIPANAWSVSIDQDRYVAYLKNGTRNIMRKIHYGFFVEEHKTETEIWAYIYKKARQTTRRTIYVLFEDAYKSLNHLNKADAMEEAYRKAKPKEYSDEDLIEEEKVISAYLFEEEF